MEKLPVRREQLFRPFEDIVSTHYQELETAMLLQEDSCVNSSALYQYSCILWNTCLKRAFWGIWDETGGFINAFLLQLWWLWEVSLYSQKKIFKWKPSNYIYTWRKALSNKRLVLMFGVIKGFIEVSATSEGAPNPISTSKPQWRKPFITPNIKTNRLLLLRDSRQV